jgi:hypothetical protein
MKRAPGGGTGIHELKEAHLFAKKKNGEKHAGFLGVRAT